MYRCVSDGCRPITNTIISLKTKEKQDILGLTRANTTIISGMNSTFKTFEPHDTVYTVISCFFISHAKTN